MLEGEYRPGGEQFAEGSASDQAFTLGNPVDLAGNIRALIQQETKGKVHPAVWLRFKVKNMVKEAIGTKAPKEKSQFFIDAFNAYSILAYNHFPEEERPTVAMDLRIWASEGVTLEDPRSLQLVETMAEATDIPYTPGQTRFELPSEVIEGL
jgi:hypothetical protein